MTKWVGGEVAGVVQTMINGMFGGNQPTNQRRGPPQNMRQGDSNDNPEENEIPDPPERDQGGFNIGSMIASLGSMFMGNNSSNSGERARRRPVFEE